MSSVSLEIENALRQLDPKSAAVVERLLGELLVAVRQKSKRLSPNTAVDANGWPIGYWEKFAGILAGEEWEPSPDPPPEPTPDW